MSGISRLLEDAMDRDADESHAKRNALDRLKQAEQNLKRVEQYAATQQLLSLFMTLFLIAGLILLYRLTHNGLLMLTVSAFALAFLLGLTQILNAVGEMRNAIMGNTKR